MITCGLIMMLGVFWIKVGELEAAVMTAKSAVHEAITESQGVRLERDAAEERAMKREAARRELADEVSPLSLTHLRVHH